MSLSKLVTHFGAITGITKEKERSNFSLRKLNILGRSVLRVGGVYFRVIKPGQQRSHVKTVASRRQYCVWFDRTEIWTSNLFLQWRTRYRSTTRPAIFSVFSNRMFITPITSVITDSVLLKTFTSFSLLIFNFFLLNLWNTLKSTSAWLTQSCSSFSTHLLVDQQQIAFWFCCNCSEKKSKVNWKKI